ncbi:hypothetical protein [Arenibaculum sp.]|jgi:hypothetical protein|uniref:hypothetical protein n=1 Tax=Arenibaculum sp. TaxID=2865862 RepID=UPI002E0F8A10|nr:hypothetical protein [Arenibaculum sp.]
MRIAFVAATLAALATGRADAAVIEGSGDPPPGPATGGEGVRVPEGQVRLECWQHGRKIIDVPELVISSMSIASQANSVGFLGSEDGNGRGVLFTQVWTACLLTPTD